METRTKLRTRSLVIAAGAITAVILAVVAVLFWTDDDRQRVVAERGEEVMPFDLDATTHHFEPRPDGGMQTVTADDPSDQEQIDLIREHLREEEAAFASGDFDDPAQIHGEEMPGLATLRENTRRIDIAYANTETGAELRYTTDDDELIAALHDWFAAQTSDHGSHAADLPP